ncbi:MAG: ShlB/FhaC/HecB family hemolysin secretion/activation protein, partial [Ferruginibacter sp.]
HCSTLFVFSILLLSFSSSAQETKTVVAGNKYQKSKYYQSLWGKNYRKEWTTPVTVKVVMLDTLAGGLTPYEIGGSRQTKSVRLRDKNNREYVLRSIDKAFSPALPPIVKGSFIEKLANDEVSIGHPYSAVTIPPLAKAAKIYHTNPVIYYIPKQKALGQFNDEIGDNLYLFEQRPDENWETAPNFGNPSNIKNTDNTIKKLLKDNDDKVDQVEFARARLFDMFIGDWGRHEDQWRWAEFKDGKQTIYKPIPRDRDQAYTKFEGRLLKGVKRFAAPHLQSFSDDIKHVNKFNYPARNLDRHFLNEVSLEQWEATAADMQRSLTDQVIDDAMKQLPAEVYSISGPEIAAKLKSRRNHLMEFAEKYYKVLARSVDITGSEEREFFEVKRLNDNETQVNIFKITDKGRQEKPFYSRTFYKKETFEVRLYGIGGNDEYEVSGKTNDGMSVRLIGGKDKDKYTDLSHVKGSGHKTEIYDDASNEFTTTKETSLHLSRDPAIHEFKYATYKFDKKGFIPIVFYNNDDKLFVGLTYNVTRNKWRKEPYGFKQSFDVKYSISQKAFSLTYKSVFTKLIGKWDGVFYANYDFIRWTNFYGLGNESKFIDTLANFNRMRTRTYIGNVGVQRLFGSHQRVYLNGFYQGVDIINDTDRYVAKSPYNALTGGYKNNHFVGANIGYVFQKLNDSILPTRGVSFGLDANYTHNLQDQSKSFARFGTEVNVYVPFTKNLGIMVRGGGATLAGTPEFYQYNKIASSHTVRGHRRDRFSGESTVYNQNELRWISNVRSYIYNGKIGFFGLYDVGRVWIKNENSNKIHYAYGGGIMLSPYNRLTGLVSYAVSEEFTNVHISLVKIF